MKTETPMLAVAIRSGAKPLSDVLAYTNTDVVERIAKDNNLSPQDADEILTDTLRFLYLAGATDAANLAPTKEIDMGWHAFLMFTKDYADFCHQNLGRFVHHAPRRSNDPAPKINHLAVTFDIARQFFGNDLSKNWQFDIRSADCESTKCTSSCSPDTGGGGNECTPDYDK